MALTEKQKNRLMSLIYQASKATPIPYSPVYMSALDEKLELKAESECVDIDTLTDIELCNWGNDEYDEWLNTYLQEVL